jgi:hypothetical protein
MATAEISAWLELRSPVTTSEFKAENNVRGAGGGFTGFPDISLGTIFGVSFEVVPWPWAVEAIANDNKTHR